MKKTRQHIFNNPTMQYFFCLKDRCNRLSVEAEKRIWVERPVCIAIVTPSLDQARFLSAFIDNINTEWCFHIKNAGWRLCRRDYILFYWKVLDIPNLFFKLMFFTYFVSFRRQYVAMMLWAIQDGRVDETKNFGA